MIGPVIKELAKENRLLSQLPRSIDNHKQSEQIEAYRSHYKSIDQSLETTLNFVATLPSYTILNYKQQRADLIDAAHVFLNLPLNLLLVEEFIRLTNRWIELLKFFKNYAEETKPFELLQLASELFDKVCASCSSKIISKNLAENSQHEAIIGLIIMMACQLAGDEEWFDQRIIKECAEFYVKQKLKSILAVIIYDLHTIDITTSISCLTGYIAQLKPLAKSSIFNYLINFLFKNKSPYNVFDIVVCADFVTSRILLAKLIKPLIDAWIQFDEASVILIELRRIEAHIHCFADIYEHRHIIQNSDHADYEQEKVIYGYIIQSDSDTAAQAVTAFDVRSICAYYFNPSTGVAKKLDRLAWHVCLSFFEEVIRNAFISKVITEVCSIEYYFERFLKIIEKNVLDSILLKDFNEWFDLLLGTLENLVEENLDKYLGPDEKNLTHYKIKMLFDPRLKNVIDFSACDHARAIIFSLNEFFLEQSQCHCLAAHLIEYCDALLVWYSKDPRAYRDEIKEIKAIKITVVNAQAKSAAKKIIELGALSKHQEPLPLAQNQSELEKKIELTQSSEPSNLLLQAEASIPITPPVSQKEELLEESAAQTVAVAVVPVPKLEKNKIERNCFLEAKAKLAELINQPGQKFVFLKHQLTHEKNSVEFYFLKKSASNFLKISHNEFFDLLKTVVSQQYCDYFEDDSTIILKFTKDFLNLEITPELKKSFNEKLKVLIKDRSKKKNIKKTVEEKPIEVVETVNEVDSLWEKARANFNSSCDAKESNLALRSLLMMTIWKKPLPKKFIKEIAVGEDCALTFDTQ